MDACACNDHFYMSTLFLSPKCMLILEGLLYGKNIVAWYMQLLAVIIKAHTPNDCECKERYRYYLLCKNLNTE